MIIRFKKYSLYKTLTAFYVFLYIAFLVSTFFTVHSHKLPDGRIVSHSHFSLSNTNEKTEKETSSHSHREIEFIFIVSAKDFQVIVADGLQLNPVIREFELQFINTKEVLVYNEFSLPTNKSPPRFI